MNSARIFASRNHIIEWINRILNINMTKIQQLGSGVIYCLILDAAYPSRIPISKLKWYANTEVDFIHNFKILQNSFLHLGIEKKIQINKLIKAKYQDNLDFIQWLKWYLQHKIDQEAYDPVKRRQNKPIFLQFCEHKVMKVPADINPKFNQKYFQRSKNVQRINKKSRKSYKLNDQFLEIFQCKTDQSDDQREQNQFKSIQKAKRIMLKTVTNFGKYGSKILQLDDCALNEPKSDQNDKQNKLIDMNKDRKDMGQGQSLQCIYSSPKQIKKFYFPERFSQRLKKRVDIVNGLRYSSVIKNTQSYIVTNQEYCIDQNQTKISQTNIRQNLDCSINQSMHMT